MRCHAVIFLAVAMLIFVILLPVQLVYVYRPVNYAFQSDAISVNASYEEVNIAEYAERSQPI